MSFIMHQNFIPFLWLDTIPLCGWTTFCLSIHLLTDTWMVSTFFGFCE